MKTLIAIATALFAMSTVLTSAAEAKMRFRVGLGVGLALGALAAKSHYGHRHHKRRYYVARRKAKKVYVAKKKPAIKKTTIARKMPAPAPAPVETAAVEAAQVENENSSISTAALPQTGQFPPIEALNAEPTKAAAPVVEAAVEPADKPVAASAAPQPEAVASKPKTVNKLDCKQFFPSVGLTLSVPCE